MPRSKHAPKKTRKPRKRTSNPTFSTYIYKVLKQVHPDVGLSNHAMTIMNDFVHFTLRRVAAQAQILVDAEKAKTIDSRAIQTAVRLELPGELAKHAVSEGTKAVTKWSAAQGTKGSLSKKAGLQFPVSRCKAQLRKYTSADRIGNGAAVYLAAICEYMTAEILELAGNASKDLKVKRVTPRHITLAVRGDEELDHFLDGVTIRGGGVIPHIHKSLIAKSSGSMSSFGAPSTSFGNTSIFGQGFGSTAMPLGQGFGATTTPASTSFGNTAIFGQGFGTGTTTPASGFGQSLPGTTVFSVNTPGGFTFGGAPQGGFSFGTATGPANPIPNFGALNIKDEDEDGEDEEDEE